MVLGILTFPCLFVITFMEKKKKRKVEGKKKGLLKIK